MYIYVCIYVYMYLYASPTMKDLLENKESLLEIFYT